MDLTPAQWLAILGTGGIGYIANAIRQAIKDRAELKNAKPRHDVTALSDSLDAQGQTITRLTTENDRLSKRITTQGKRLEALEARYEELERKSEREFQTAIRFVNRLIALWPSTTIPIPAVPVLLSDHVDTPDPQELNP